MDIKKKQKLYSQKIKTHITDLTMQVFELLSEVEVLTEENEALKKQLNKEVDLGKIDT